MSLDPRINSRKYTIENSSTLSFTKEADPKKSPYYKVVHAFDSGKVMISQSFNGLLLCTGSRRHAFDYIYSPSTNLLKILPEPDYANVDSNVYGCPGLRLAFDPKNYLTTKWCMLLILVNPSTNLLKILPEPDYANVDSNVYGCPGLRLAFDPKNYLTTKWCVVEYNLILKKLREMYDIGSNQLTDDYHDGFIPPGFIPPFAMYDMRPKQVDHKVYEFISSYESV
nr:hypothetical protein [Tanacetum cinerariifolium]